MDLVIYKFFSQFNLKQKSRESNDVCFSEWSLLNKDFYFRRNLSFYYTDLKIIRVYYMTRIKLFPKRKIPSYLIVYLKNKKIYLKKITHKVVFQYISFSLEYIDFNFNYPVTNESLKVKVKNRDDESTSIINLVIKPFRSRDLKKNFSMICSKLYESKDSFSEFKWWIEMNRKIGYSKVVIYYNSNKNSFDLDNFINKNNDFVELIEYKCIPNFLNQTFDTRKMFINNFDGLG